LAALLHGTRVVGLSQTAAFSRGVFGRAAITMGIGSHFSSVYFCIILFVKGGQQDGHMPSLVSDNIPLYYVLGK